MKRQTTLTREFDRWMKQAPFKRVPQSNDPQTMLRAEELQKHFDEFASIFKATGLPAICNRQKLLAKKEDHRESIQISQECHEKLGFVRPQQELRASCSKPIWSPIIWQGAAICHLAANLGKSKLRSCIKSRSFWLNKRLNPPSSSAVISWLSCQQLSIRLE